MPKDVFGKIWVGDVLEAYRRGDLKTRDEMDEVSLARKLADERGIDWSDPEMMPVCFALAGAYLDLAWVGVADE